MTLGFLSLILLAQSVSLIPNESLPCEKLRKASKAETTAIFKKFAKDKAIPYEDSLGVLCQLPNERESCQGLEGYFTKEKQAIFRQRLPFEDGSIIICKVGTPDPDYQDKVGKDEAYGQILDEDPPTFLKKLGLKKDDFILSINGKRLNLDKAPALYELNTLKGTFVIEYERDGKRSKVTYQNPSKK